MHSTNYYNTIILPAEDCSEKLSIPPAIKPEKLSIAAMQYQLLIQNPYQMDSDEVIFQIDAKRKNIEISEQNKEEFFNKGRACFRASPLTKRYGWAIHSNENGKIALVDTASKHFETLQQDETIEKKYAMRNKRK